MVWTEVSWLLAAVAALFLLVLLIAIFADQILGADTRSYPRFYRRSLPDNAELSDEDRLKAMHRFARGHGANDSQG